MISAIKGNGVADLEALVMKSLPFSRPFYDEDQITDRSERFLAAEMIREALTERLHQELPYALTVEIESFKRDGGLVRIGAVIWVERESQKQITIGKGGQVLKQIGSQARRALEELLDSKVFLQTFVKVSKDWSRKEKMIAKFGYDD
jgi:GTP-binding protein Era